MKESDDTFDILRISGNRTSNDPCFILIDEYVPLRLETYREPFGVGYVRLGNYLTTLMELEVEPHTQVIRGINVTSIGKLLPWPAFEVPEMAGGLPGLSTSLEGYGVIDLPHDFSVAIRPGEVLIFWKDLGICRGFRFGNACFLAVDNVLAGVWFTGLPEDDVKLFASHASRV